MNTRTYQVAVSVFAVVITIVLLTQSLDVRSQQYTDEALKRALITFAVARALNGAISVAQGTEIALQPAGVGITLTPGEILDPINDLVERFSWVMLLASASLGVLKLLLTISAGSWFTGAILLVLAAGIIMLWLPQTARLSATQITLKFALVLIALRLAAPLVAITSEGIYEAFLASQYKDATEQLDQTTSEIGRINDEAASDESTDSLWSGAQRFYKSATSQLDVEARIEAYKEAVADASLHLVNLIAIFVLQTILLPLIFLYLFYVLTKQLLTSLK